MRARTRWIRLQRMLTHRLQGYARRILGGLNPELKKYFLRYQKDLSDFKEVSTKRELLFRLQNTSIVLCGDYHTLSQAQRTVIRLLRDSIPALKRRKKSLILALEMVRPRDNPVIAKYLRGEMKEADFLEAIAFRKNWGFNWANYRRLFHFAREQGIEVVGINYGTSRRVVTLKARDRFAAKAVIDLVEKDSNNLVFVLVGDMHLAQAHLPAELTREGKRRGKVWETLIIHQNSERFYWRLIEQGLEQLVDVVKVSDTIYCVMNTPPWVKLRSHVKWAELMAEAEEGAPLLPSKDGEGTDPFTIINYAEEIRDLVAVMQKFIGTEVPTEDDYHVYGPSDLSFLNRLARDPDWSPLARRVIARCLTEFDSFFIPRDHILFLTDLSLNHAATQAAVYLHAKLSGDERLFLRPREDFYPALWTEALGFFGSRIINHKRKCNGPRDLQRLVEQAAPRRKKSRVGNAVVAEAALAHLQAERQWRGEKSRDNVTLNWRRIPRATRNPRHILFYLKIAKILGQLLGHALHAAVMDSKVSHEEIRALFQDPFRSPREARRLYLEWAERLDEHGFREVRKSDRL